MSVWLLVFVPLAAAAAAALVARYSAAIATGGLVSTVVVAVWTAGTEASASIAWGGQLELTAAITGFARVMVVLVPVIALPIVVFAAATERAGRTRLIVLLTAFVAVMELLVVAADMLTLLIGWELVGAVSWILIAHDHRAVSNVQRASHAFITTRAGDLGLYVAAGALFAATGTFSLSAVHDAGPGARDVIAFGVLLAAAAKSAQVPFSPWLFSAMAGPTPVSALLHSSTMVAAGAYLLIRVAPELDTVTWFAPALSAIGVASALGGGIVAAVHRHPKRLLAASTSAQYGLMFVAIGAGSVVAAGAQLVAHAAFKSLLFLSAGVAMHAAGSDDLSDMRLGHRLPTTAAFAAIGALALAALPPLGGAWSKEQITGAAFESSPALGFAVLGAAVLSAIYALRYWLLAFGPGSGEPRADTPLLARASIGYLALLSAGLGVLWIAPMSEAAARWVSGDVVPTGALELAAGVAILALAAGSVVALERRDRLVGGAGGPVAEAASDWFGIASAARRLVVTPVLAVSRAFAMWDDRVIDAGVRASVRVAAGISRLLGKRTELSIDRLVMGVAGGTLRTASGSRVADDRGLDRAVESLASAVGHSGQMLRKLQTGLSHHYYLLVAAGAVVLAAVLATGTS